MMAVVRERPRLSPRRAEGHAGHCSAPATAAAARAHRPISSAHSCDAQQSDVVTAARGRLTRGCCERQGTGAHGPATPCMPSKLMLKRGLVSSACIGQSEAAHRACATVRAVLLYGTPLREAARKLCRTEVPSTVSVGWDAGCASHAARSSDGGGRASNGT